MEDAGKRDNALLLNTGFSWTRDEVKVALLSMALRPLLPRRMIAPSILVREFLLQNKDSH